MIQLKLLLEVPVYHYLLLCMQEHKRRWLLINIFYWCRVGVGSANFENMQILDGDEKALRSKGQTAERDIVQVSILFVHFLSSCLAY